MKTSDFMTRVLAVVAVAAVLASAAPAQANRGLWISDAELAALPMSGTAWQSVKSAADQSTGTPDVSNQDDDVNVRVLAKALVYGRTRNEQYRTDVINACVAAIDTEGGGRTLALGRELMAYVISADIVGLPADKDTIFRAWLRRTLTEDLDGKTLIFTHETRPNNWGTSAGASRLAVALYLGDTAQVQRIAAIFKGWLGDRASYSGFEFGELDWQADPSKPVGINPKGSTKLGHSIDGVLPEEMRRSGGFAWPPPKENYVYTALEGAIAQAHLLYRAGYDAWNWQDKAMLRAYQWLHEQANFPATGNDTWQPHVINHYYSTSFPAPIPSMPGKNAGWSDWTFASRSTDTCPKCSDQTKDCGESDVDCGQFCNRCAVGKACAENADCASLLCEGGTCAQNTQASCSDGIKNQDETDIDCGGSCSMCSNGKACLANDDCKSRNCLNHVCTVAQASCSDGIKNQDETDIDCGGKICPDCGDGDRCVVGTDCASGVCSLGRCINPNTGTCSDNLRNQDESDVDCGGTVCSPCLTGKQCLGNSDCASVLCERHACVPLPAPVLLKVEPVPGTGESPPP